MGICKVFVGDGFIRPEATSLALIAVTCPELTNVQTSGRINPPPTIVNLRK
ncbi:MAG: hypothetical protein FWG87_09770 [Defluviitaleaceae bacterium]|nr:hypothetical protein [Defluviitaleaceae bacterium]